MDAEPATVGRQSGNTMPTEISEKSAVGSLPAAFCENFEQCGISTIIAARREDSVPPRVRCPTHAPVRDTRTNRVRNTFWRAFRAISVFHQQVRRPQALAIGLEERGYQVRCSADRVRHETVTFNLSRSTPRSCITYNGDGWRNSSVARTISE